ncbi:MAG: ABC transporter ATP-binding protein [Bacillota bacterium]|nr:ABC transporter ATP-binding protein [Bacillota bacterium]
MSRDLKLKLHGISATYSTGEEKLPVLDNVSLAVATGEFVSVIGPSGSGKSTLLKIAAGLLKPEQGKILIDGRDVTGLPRLVGYMPQQDLLFPWKTLRQNAALPLVAARLEKKEIEERIEKLLPIFGLQGFGEYYPDQLSGGMRQRGALMRTMLIESDLLLLDEPFAALDALTRQNLQEWLLKIWDRFRRSVLFVTHSIDEAIYLSDRVYVITERPGKNAFEQIIDIPRPRSKSVITTPPFSRYKKLLLEALADDAAAGTK